MLTNVRRIMLVAVVLGQRGAGVAQESKSEARPASFTILLPADAELEINGEKIDGTGDLRRWQSPLAAADADVDFTLKAMWKEERKKRATERKVTVRGGQKIEVDLYDDKVFADEKIVLELTNKEREKAGLAPLVINMKLTRAARGHSANMARQNIMSHELDGKTFFQRIAEVYYRSGQVGENCASGSRNPTEAVRGWLNSPPHRENMLNPGFQEIGIGVASSKQGRRYWTQVFAAPAGR